jgi:hypothetical protein
LMFCEFSLQIQSGVAAAALLKLAFQHSPRPLRTDAVVVEVQKSRDANEARGWLS